MAKFNDPFKFVRTIIFVDMNSYKVIKTCNVLLNIIYSLIHCLLIYYLCKNLEINLLIRYAPAILLFILVIFGAVFSIYMDEDILEVRSVFRENRWSLSVLKENSQTKLGRKCQFINIFILLVLLLIVSTLAINAPCFGNQRELLICIQVFEEYFGEWSFIPYYFFFLGFPLLYYNFFRLWMTFVYGLLEGQLQFFILEEYLCGIYETEDSKSWKYLQDSRYQQEIEKSLRLCISHHIGLKKFLKMVENQTLKVMPFYLVFGVLILICYFSFIINFADTVTTIGKIRMFMTAICMMGVAILLSWIGQQLIDVTSDIYFTLGGAPWYYWSQKNAKLLLMFLTNCTKNESVTLAGISLDFTLFVSIVHTTLSYALVLYNLRESSLVSSSQK
ncbi:odorant receptor 213 [Tribolium castaneum]|uniref:Odorant receptor n=1 Tax=Tribolium castaneum TaxID=7070 RepID=D6WHL0_TRICA|nr:PREDICTED: uncharacterized protein LOC107397671 [Tribolium castaneum]EFA01399.1 odorant receptor 213 [Tribolium castaneum]|eukprot:XP_015834062.1 PREDICTED: uncharacterized protein LOC107397671 [Tribolium castaneum]